MKSEKKTFLLIEGVLFLILSVVIIIMLKDKSTKEPIRISVIVNNSEDSQWAAFKYGLDVAARDKGVALTYVSTEEGLTIEEIKNRITQEIRQGADGIIAQPLSSLYGEDLVMNSIAVPVVYVETQNKEEKSQNSFVGYDNYRMGKSLAEKITEGFESGLEGKKVGILNFGIESFCSNQRKQGVIDELRGSGATIAYYHSYESYEELKMGLGETNSVDILIALDDVSLKNVGKYFETEKSSRALLYGIASSEEAIYYLDTGVAECLIIPDGFNEGYKSLTELVKQITHTFYTPVTRTVGYKILTKENLFSDENEQLLYTISQSN